MRPIPLMLLGAVVGAALASACWWLATEWGGTRPVVPAPPAGEPSAAELSPAVDATPRLARIEQQLARLSEQVTELSAAVSSPDRVPVAPADDSSIDQATLVAALGRAQAEREAKRLAGLTTRELIAEARRLRRENPAAARRALDQVLARALSAEDRGEALLQLGLLHRGGGDLEASERALQEAVDLTADTGRRAWMSYELAIAAMKRGDHARSLALAEQVVRTPGVDEGTRLHGLWVTSTVSHELGDTTRARAEYQAILAACGDDEQYAWLRRDVSRRLASLR